MNSGKLREFAVILLYLILGTTALAQTNVNEEQGMKPYDSWHGGDLDSVSMTNGALVLHIPLASFPQRGNLNLTFSVYANTKNWQAVTYCISDPGNPPDCSHTKWEPLPRGGLLPPMPQGQLLVNIPNYAVDGAYVASSLDYWFQSFSQVEPCSDPNQGCPVTFYDWAQNIVSPDGNAHVLFNSGASGSTSPGPAYPLRSLDPTGMLFDGSNLILPNGTRFSFANGGTPQTDNTAPSSVTDSNGNQITISSSTGAFTDTLGRLIQAPPGSVTSDLSNCPAGAVFAKNWGVPGPMPNASTRVFKFCYSNFTIFTNFAAGPDEYPSTSQALLSAIVLPDQTQWTFAYDNYGDVTHLGFPTGGSITYTYAIAPGYMDYNPNIASSGMAVTSRTVDANDGTGGHKWTYTYSSSMTGTPPAATVTVTSPDGNDTVHSIGAPISGAPAGLQDVQVQYYQGPRNTGTLLKTQATQYSGFPDPTVSQSGTASGVVPTQATTTWPDGHTSKVVNTWDSGTTEMPLGQSVPIVLGSLLQRDEYDYSNTLVRSTVNQYLWHSDSTYFNNNFLSLLSSTTLNSGGTQFAKTTYGYDEVPVVSSGIITPSLVAPPAGGNIRGNRTTTSRWLDKTNSLVSSTATYFDTGMLGSSTPPANADGLNRTTNYLYSATYLGAYLTETDMPDTQMPDSGAPVVHHKIRGGYDYNTGLLTSFTDENGQIFNYQYDNMLRLKEGDHPDGGQTLFTYPDPNTVIRQRLISGNTYDNFTAKFDGVGRNYETLQDTPSGTVEVDTAFDPVGRAASVSNPYYQGTSHSSDPTYGITQTQYDALSRVTKTIKQDQSASTVQYNTAAADGQSSAVECTTASDESGKPRQVCSDALGRMVKVIEPNASSLPTNATASVSIGGVLNSSQTGDAARSGSSLTSYVDSSGVGNAVYIDSNNHVITVSQDSSDGLHVQDITALSGGTPAGTGSGLTSFAGTYSPHIYYQGTNGHLFQFWWNGSGSNWANNDLTAASGTSIAPASGTALTSFWNSSIGENSFYIGTNNHVYQMLSNGSLSNNDLTAMSGATPAIAGSALAQLDNYTVVYQCSNGDICQIWFNGSNSTWVYNDMTVNSGSSTIPATRTALTAFEGSGGGHEIYLGQDNHLHDMFWNGSTLVDQDLTVLSAGVPAAPGSNLSNFGGFTVVYEGANQHIYQIWWNGSNWINNDLTASAGTGVVAAPSSALTSYLDSPREDSYYLGTNNHVYRLLWTGSSMANLDVTSGSILDSGIVTLQVGSFNATACFGPSTNPSCLGQTPNSDNVQVAAALAQAINVAGSPATATASGSTLSLVWKMPGPFTPDVSALSTVHDQPNVFTNPSFTSAETTFAGGSGASLSTNPYITTYQYNARGDMLCVHQKATDTSPDVACSGASAPSVPPAWRQRFFNYDSFSRLLTAMNPETNSTGSSQITYAYDADSNVISKTEPAPNQAWGSSQTVSMTYTYDALNRLLNTTFSDGVTPNTAHRYDYSSYLGQSLAYPIGREVAATSANGAQSFTSYDPMGRVAGTVQCTPGVSPCKTFSAGYDKLGDMTSLVYPSGGFTVTYAYDTAARLTSAVDSNGITYAQTQPSNILASGALNEFAAPNFNNNKYHVDYNNRLQPTEIWTGSAEGATALFDKQYQYNPPNVSQMNNGNIYTVTNVKDSTRTQSFTYDSLNRLTSAGDQTHWYNSYTYDPWGNLTQKTKGTLPSGETLSTSASTTNQLLGYSYDAAGNMLNDGINGWTYVYDAENRITTAGSTTYTYDADGRRVKKSSGTNYWYGPTGAALAETDGSGNWTDYIFFGGQRLARNVSGDIKYYITDHLHSTAVFADKSGTILDDNDFYPWGGVVPGVGQTTSNNTVKFTGQYRDTESNLDYFGARYYANATGRFMTPDWDGKPTTVPYAQFGDPQSLNLYSYVRNSPITRVDATGHNPTFAGWQGAYANTTGGMTEWDYMSDAAEAVQNAGAMHNNEARKAEREQRQQQQQQQQQQAATPAKGQSTVTVYWLNGLNGNIFGHVDISVDGSSPVGFDTKSGVYDVPATAGASVPGAVKPVDIAKRTVWDKATLHVTAEQSTSMSNAIQERTKHPGWYQDTNRNCTQFLIDVLHAGGVKLPNSIRPSGLMKDLHQFQKDHPDSR